METEDGFDPIDADRLAAELVRAGFFTREEVVEAIIDVLRSQRQRAGSVRSLAVRATDGAISDQKRAESSWPPLTDCDRLDVAFERLEDTGLLARHNMACKRGLGHADIAAEVDEAIAQGLPVRGYVFYRREDTERAVEMGELILAFGALEASEAAILGVGREIASTLESCGLKAGWEGSVRDQIRVALDWRRRFPSG